MGVTVVTTTTASTADVVRLRASVSVADAPNVATVVQLPAAQIEYIDLTLSVVLDTLGRFKLLADSVGVADVLALTAQKLLSDSLLTADFRRLEPRKGLSDSVGMTDEITRTLVFLRNFADSVSLADARTTAFTLGTRREFLTALSEQAFEYNKFIPDGVAMNDSASLGDGSTYFFDKGIINMAFVGDARASSVGKLLTEAAGVQDVDTKAVAKAFFEPITIADASVYEVSKPFAEALSTPDFRVFAYDKPFAEVLTVVDARVVSYDKPFTDTAGVADADTVVVDKPQVEAISVADLIARVAQKAFTETASTTDTTLLSFSASRVESVGVPDSGFLRSQDYCDPTYFAEDYVGVSQSF
jgi:hypothetical protein